MRREKVILFGDDPDNETTAIYPAIVSRHIRPGIFRKTLFLGRDTAIKRKIIDCMECFPVYLQGVNKAGEEVDVKVC